MNSPYGKESHLLGVLLVAVISMVCQSSVASGDCKAFIIDMLMGEPVPVEVMIDDLASVRVVYIGEVHTIERHHEMQTQILKLLAKRNPKLALGLEMFGAYQQPALDKWQKGSEDISSLIKDLGPHYWTNLDDYKNLLLAARDLNIPIIGLNASDFLVRKVARHGLEDLTAEERAQIPSGLKEINPDHDRLLRMKLLVHRGFKDKDLDNIVLAQALRDAAMAHTAARFLSSPQGKDANLVVVTGSGHINYGFGVPERLERLTGFSYRIVVPTESGELVLTEEEKRQAAPLDITHEDVRFIRRPIADYLHVIPRKEPPQPVESDPLVTSRRPPVPGPNNASRPPRLVTSQKGRAEHGRTWGFHLERTMRKVWVKPKETRVFENGCWPWALCLLSR